MTRERSTPLCSTPRTDAECRVTVGYDRQYQSLHVPADFARKLERELEEAQRLIKNLAPTGRYNGLDIEGWYQEAQRYRNGMENWKATAEAKDAAMLTPSATTSAHDQPVTLPPDFGSRIGHVDASAVAAALREASKDIPPEFAEVVNEKFWELLA